MKNNKIIQIIACTLLCFGMQGCNSDEEIDIGNEPVAVQFSSSVGNVAKQRTTVGGDQWLAGDKIGIFMLKESASLVSTNIVGGADNKGYQAQTQTGNNATSSFTPVDGTPIYYPITGKVDFIAYYPHTTPLTDYELPVNVSNQSDPSKIDVLYSNNAKGYNKNSTAVDLQFSHALSKLSFTLKVGNGSPDLTGATISISHVKTTADVNLATGLVENLVSEGTITAHTDATAIVIPQITGSSCKLTVTLVDGVSKFECDFSTQPFVQGKNHPYTITVNRTGITVSAGNITDWDITDGEITGDTAIRYKVGDYYPDPDVVYDENKEVVNGTKATGIVYWLDTPDNGKSKHGKIVSLDEGSQQWSPVYANTSTDLDNGKANMEKIKTLNPALDKYPVFAWCANKGDSWYLPAKDELKALSDAYSTYGKSDFNGKLTAASGGIGLSDTWYWSSSENDNYDAWIVYFLDGYTLTNYKYSNYRVRAVSAF